jgi:hypothetical protein
MLQPKSLAPDPPPTARTLRRQAELAGPRPFFGAIDAVLVDDQGEYVFEGAIRRSEAQSVWTWMHRDVAPDLINADAPADSPDTLAALDAIAPALLARARGVAAGAAADREAQRRLRAQLGGNEVWARLPAILNALRCAPLYERARAFGRGVNGLPDEESVQSALQAMPRQDVGASSLLMMAAMSEVTNPARLIVPATRLAGGTGETELVRAGFAPLLDACIARAQNALPPLLQNGVFADLDLVCRSIDRFHRLVRALSANVELLPRGGRWLGIIAGLTKTVSDRLEPRLRDIPVDINRALRRREGTDRLDDDAMLAALNGAFLLATVRECRDSLAVNEAFDEAWGRTSQTLELHLTRNLDALRENPRNYVLAARVDGGIKMAKLRFGADYADVLRKARDTLERRLNPN